MSYYNHFTCTLQNLKGEYCDEDTSKGILYYLKSYNGDADQALNCDGSSNVDISHWEYINDFSEFSKQFPEVVFCLEVFGDSGRFKLYFNDGKHQRVEVEFPNFDLNIMKG